MKILVTGGLGVIGAAVVRRLIRSTEHEVVLDAMTYAALPEALEGRAGSGRYSLEKGDIQAPERVRSVFESHKPGLVMRLAAESPVERSIDGLVDFIQTNIIGTFNMLQGESRVRFRFHHISTDEVFGSLALGAPAFTEATRCDPLSSYSTPKAASDHLAVGR
jgi:dTDP-glucose 4,6-dehydratase